MNRLKFYLSPLARLGHAKYSLLFPFLGTLLLLLTLELVLLNFIPESIASAVIITMSALLVIYFSFRDGVRGGLLSTGVVIAYYIYIILSRLEPSQMSQAFQTTAFLGTIYLGIGGIIGWLRQSIDKLIIKEKESSAQAHSEKKRLKSLLDQLPVAVRIVNVEEKKIEGNKKLEELLKRKLKSSLDEELAYMADHEFKKGKRLNIDELVLTKPLRTRKKVVLEDIEYRREDGKRFYFKVSAAPIFDGKRRVSSVVSVMNDFTAEREAQIRKDNFISMASHELKTPITSLKLYLALLHKRALEDKDEAFIDPILNLKTQTERLEQLSADLLDVSRIQTGKLHFTKQKIKLDELIKEVCLLFQETRPDKKIKFSNGKSIVIEGDRFRIYQVLTNLLTNALKFSDKGKEVIVDMKKFDGHAQISVKDYGIGLDPSEKKKIFNLLYQVNDPRKRTFPGLGMGLYISKEIIKNHKGKIWVDSKKGKGSTFYFTIPVKN